MIFLLKVRQMFLKYFYDNTNKKLLYHKIVVILATSVLRQDLWRNKFLKSFQ